MTKLLIVYAHPSHEGFHAYFLDSIIALLKVDNQTEYEILDLYALQYNPVLSDEELYSSGRRLISQENLNFQNKIKEADRLLFIYPTWWQNMPAILKGFIDRVFVGGFAFTYKAGLPIGLLSGKKAAAFSATGGPSFYSALFTRQQSLRVLTKDILAFAGIKSKGFSLGSARKFTDASKPGLDKIAQKVLDYLLD